MKKAFSLIELIVVIVIISVGLGTLLAAVRSANVNNAYSHFMSVALGLVEGRTEAVLYHRMKGGFDYITNDLFPPEDPVTSYSGFRNYKRETDIAFVNLSNLNTTVASETSYKRVRVTVTSKVGIQGKVELVTIISDCE